MALIKYTAQPPPVSSTSYRPWLYAELRKIDRANAAIINLLEVLGDTPIEIGANDSAGVGYRVLRVPNI